MGKMKKPFLYCKCKMCGSTYLEKFPTELDSIDCMHIGKVEKNITTTHDCSTGTNSLPDAYGVGEILGVIYM